jgi:hypothetical protein
MRLSSTVLGVVAALALAPVIAHGGPANKPQKAGKPTTVAKPTTSVKPTKSATMTAKPMVQGAPKAAPKSAHKPATSKPVTTTTARTTGKPATTGKAAKAPSTPTTTTTTTTASKGGKHGGTTTTVTTTTTAPLNPIAAKIASKPNLNSKLTGMLPIDPLTGRTMTLDKASLGFKNQGQFIAALHVSENLGIPFTELKSHMVTVTPGAPGELPTASQTGSLGQAIQASKKTTTSVTTEVERAELQASADLKIATTTTTTKTTPKGGVR